MLNIGILFGGISVEHDISIISAIQVMNNIDRNKYNVIPLYLTKTGELVTGKRFEALDTFKKEIEVKKSEWVNLSYYKGKCNLSFPFKKFKKTLKIDLILPVVHGKGVEDGNISGFLEILNIPHTTSSILGASIAQDKEFTKIILESINVKTIEYEVLYNIDNQIKNNDFPKIVKPAHLGSSIGIKKVNNIEELTIALKEAFNYDNKVIVEKALTHFKEYSIAIYNRKEELMVSDIEEIKIKNEIFKFTDKYENGLKDETNHIIPAKINKKMQEKMLETVKEIYKKFELSGVVRIDFLYDLDHKKLYVNEINTIPGSYAYYLFKEKGITFTELLNDLIKQALIDKEQRKNYISTFKSNVLNKNTLSMKK